MALVPKEFKYICVALQHDWCGMDATVARKRRWGMAHGRPSRLWNKNNCGIKATVASMHCCAAATQAHAALHHDARAAGRRDVQAGFRGCGGQT